MMETANEAWRKGYDLGYKAGYKAGWYDAQKQFDIRSVRSP